MLLLATINNSALKLNLCGDQPKSHTYLFHRTYEIFAKKFQMKGCVHFCVFLKQFEDKQ